MLRLSKKADYALISLADMAEHRGQVVSAREIAERCSLPVALLMNILKALHQKGILRSVRGASGGYQIAADLSAVSLLDLSNLVDQIEPEQELVGKKLALHGAAQALQYRLVRFMRDVSVADLVLPGRRIDVPVERVGVSHKSKIRPAAIEQPVFVSQT